MLCHQCVYSDTLHAEITRRVEEIGGMRVMGGHCGCFIMLWRARLRRGRKRGCITHWRLCVRLRKVLCRWWMWWRLVGKSGVRRGVAAITESSTTIQQSTNHLIMLSILKSALIVTNEHIFNLKSTAANTFKIIQPCIFTTPSHTLPYIHIINPYYPLCWPFLCFPFEIVSLVFIAFPYIS